MFCISSPMTERDIATALKAVEDAVQELKPDVERIWPELIGTV